MVRQTTVSSSASTYRSWALVSTIPISPNASPGPRSAIVCCFPSRDARYTFTRPALIKVTADIGSPDRWRSSPGA